ncbi:MAG: UDP-N-acetylmuramate--L-alanine ligase [Candidatus Portnoybacteria bacterium]|nr:UDP-N-acetylmuramate--L-alanine ligase [Candidatus Portnoybacteria bacterium]MDD4983076.1 UDP-N-acetylmuramate--L-alanine ligase [Candidatus Portnoybacteria bacterium]
MRIHFIGIGGIGVSALARYFLAQGDEVSGSDAVKNETVAELRKLGVKIYIGHKALNITQSDCVIFSAAVQEDNPELVEARRLGVKTQKYAAALGDLTREKYTIAVSGMHGKSTTTAMIGLMMEKAGLDPTVILGTKLKEWGNSNFRPGTSKYLVIEADEYDKSFLNYWPKILVLLNIEEEHLDTYKGGLPEIMETFGEYILHLPEDGILVVNGEDENVAKLISADLKLRVEKYSSENKLKLNLKIPGKHNVSNANAALAVAKVLGIDEKIAVEALNEFTGAWRRMEYKGELNGAKIYDDYGHHPTEIKATLEGARELLKKIPPDPPFTKWGGKLWCVFQPHQYQRTYDFFDQFVGAFGAADKTIILPIYSATGREKDDIRQKVSSEKLALRLQDQGKSENIIYASNFDEAAEYLRKNLQPGDICVIMGAGDVYKLTELVVLKQKARD